MSVEDDILAFIDLVYEAAFDSTQWPAALISLADNMKTAHIGLSTMDFRAQTYDSIAPRTDPAMTAIYRQHWAFHNPVWKLSATRPAGDPKSPDFKGGPAGADLAKPARRDRNRVDRRGVRDRSGRAGEGAGA